MVTFSANLGFLWTDRPLPAAIEAAADAGFDAVECHVPYTTPPHEVRAALERTGLPMVSINTSPGNPHKGDRGLAAVPGREREARAAIDEAITYAAAIGCPNVHVMAGIAPPGASAAQTAFTANLAYGATQAAAHGISVLIEPINPGDMPSYHLADLHHAAAVIADVGAANLRILFDCYHIALIHGDVASQFEAHAHLVGHVQFAGVPHRGEPDSGSLDYATLLPRLAELGHHGPFGAEYRPADPTDTGASLGWLTALS